MLQWLCGTPHKIPLLFVPDVGAVAKGIEGNVKLIILYFNVFDYIFYNLVRGKSVIRFIKFLIEILGGLKPMLFQ